ncbi:MAG: hypothetical protein RBT02_12170 [Bacteroidales bacterium]|jgi:hypothetical protein|nr:hypothetical protein [Bacteroidales bacterium]
MKAIIIKIGNLFLLLFMLGAGCGRETTPCACGVENPQENLEWLDHLLQKRFCTEVYSIQYEGQEYIGIYDCPDVIDGSVVIYTCDGEQFCAYWGESGKWTCEDINTDEFKAALDNKELIYKQETNPYWEVDEDE